MKGKNPIDNFNRRVGTAEREVRKGEATGEKRQGEVKQKGMVKHRKHHEMQGELEGFRSEV